jgi:XTP/dITP diphosphohydrolase
VILVLATRNKGKVAEIGSALALPSLTFKSLNDFPDVPDVLEDGSSFLENALKKARSVSGYLNLPVLADDSGLEVDFLNGAPGIYSARFSGPTATEQQNYEKLLDLLTGVPEEKRTARFVCVLVFFESSGRWIKAEGFCEGRIALASLGDQGFGYDPVFYLPEFQKTMAQLPLETKNRISHRARALEKMRPHIIKALGLVNKD